LSDLRPDRWQLPDGVHDLLPDEAWRIECLRRTVIDCCRTWGFELVMPPLIEYTDSLLTGSGEAMNLQTFKLVDQNNGRTLGVRADITPQVARLDAHALRSETPNRFCFSGTVLRTQADGAGGSRSPQQFGAELYGHAGHESDVEIIRLMLETLRVGGVPLSHQLLDLGHVGVYRALAKDCALSTSDEARVFEAMQRGSVPDVRERLVVAGVTAGPADRLVDLCSLRGQIIGDACADDSLIALARRRLAGASAGVEDALDELARIVAAVRVTHPDVRLLVDLAELRGFSYHTGTLFAVHDESGAELARGGRYDSVGEAFGHARPATGFSGELKRLLDSAAGIAAAGIAAAGTAAASPAIAGVASKHAGCLVHVADPFEPGGWREVCRLREAGVRVLCALSGRDDERPRCDRELIRSEDGWSIEPLS